MNESRKLTWTASPKLLCHEGANVIVKGSFIDLDDQCLMRQYRKLRRVMSDSVLVGVLDVPEVYEPGRFSNNVEKAKHSPPQEERAQLMGRVTVMSIRAVLPTSFN